MDKALVFKYLRERQYYEDLYDLATIKRCLDFSSYTPKGELTVVKKRAYGLVNDVSTYYLKGERYKHKSKTIDDWMRKDREKDSRAENATSPTNVLCNFCLIKMKNTASELYHDDVRVMFWFECPECNKRKAVFDNGEEFRSKPELCPKCSIELQKTFSRAEEVITTSFYCENCKYKKDELLDLKKDNEEWEEKERQSQELLKKYRHIYCLSQAEGDDYVNQTTQLVSAMNLLKERETKEANPLYQKAKKLKMLKITQVKELINKTIEKEDFSDLNFDKPEIDKYVIVGFTVNDSKESRDKADSIQQLKRLITNVLSHSNWRLMSDGISYRLGILTGRLKAYESDEDLMKLVK